MKILTLSRIATRTVLRGRVEYGIVHPDGRMPRYAEAFQQVKPVVVYEHRGGGEKWRGEGYLTRYEILGVRAKASFIQLEIALTRAFRPVVKRRAPRSEAA